jgi:hypothetical protein
MSEAAKQQSNPFSTGGGGPNFETRVQAAFTVLMLTGRIAPCLPPFQITKIKLQARYAGDKTDDFVVFSKNPDTGKEAKLLAQVKHGISLTPKSSRFADVIQSTWDDFNDQNFDIDTDAFALIKEPLSETDINDVRPILEWARSSEDEKEFFAKVNTDKFSSKGKKEKLAAFKIHLKTANNGSDVSDQQLWKFLKVFHLLGYDLDTESGVTLSLLQSLIAQYSNQSTTFLWARIVDAIQITFNQNAGTITLETLPEDIRTAFSTVSSSSWLSDFCKLKDRSNVVLGRIRNQIGGIHIKQSDAFTQLLSLTETSNFVFVSGERGSGKSSLIKEFSNYVGNRAPIFCLRTDDLNKSHIDNVFSAMGLTGSISSLEAGFALMPKKYLILESLEKLLEQRTDAFIDLLQLLQKQQGWTVIATGRDYAYQQITFNYLQPFGINFETLILNGFSDDQVQYLCDQLEPLQKFANNETLKPLLKSPFFAELAYKVLQTGIEFTPNDGEKEFRAAVWENVISKAEDRSGGMPPKRRKAFVDIAVNRAKKMVYGVPEVEFDSDAVLKLEEDNLVYRDYKNGLVSPAHDVLEDWALDKYIDDAYQKHSGNLQYFLDAIGNEPAMNRAFRLWLHQKLRCGENVEDFVYSVLNSPNIQRYWQDETIAAVLQGDNPDEFLKLLKDQLFLENGALLKRFFFILRIACQIPYQTSRSVSKDSYQKNLVDTLFLKPYGQGWKAIICFLYENRNLLSIELTTHIIAVLNDWSSLISLNEELPLPSREAGLLALHLLTDLKDSYRDDGDRKKILSIIIKTIPSIHQEFLELLQVDIFTKKTDEQTRRLCYVESFCKLAILGSESAFFSKHDPDTLIKLAYSELLTDKSKRKDEFYQRSFTGVDHYFQINKLYNFSPASGAKGLFQNLLRIHGKIGLDFILNLLNISAEEYAYSGLDAPRSSSIKTSTIHLNDGTKIQQYFSGRLWFAYRGKSVMPALLQSALMALENWLIEYAENFEIDRLETLYEYILRSSNSVMPTAVLASVATGFPQKVGRAALPLLRIPELYFMDQNRSVSENGNSEIDWHCMGFYNVRDKIYSDERRTAASRSWRRENLETLAVKLQFSQWKDEMFAAIDMLRTSEPQDEMLRFLFCRIDSRTWEPIEDKENNRIIFALKNLEPDLRDKQNQAQERMQMLNRFSAMYLWASKTFKNKVLENEYYMTWQEALIEAKDIFEQLQNNDEIDLATRYFGSIVIAAAIFVRDHSKELNETDILFCKELISQTIIINADSERNNYVIDRDSEAAAAFVLPILLDFFSEENDTLEIKSLIATALTHASENVRNVASNGIRTYLWQRDSEFAQKCIVGVLEYSRFELEQDNQLLKRRIDWLADYGEEDAENTAIQLKNKKDKFRDRFVRGEFTTDFEQIDLRTHSSWHLLSPCLMIPDGSREPSHIQLLSKMLDIFFEAEQEESKNNRDRDDNLRIHYEVRLIFTDRFAQHLYCLNELNFQPYLEQLQISCEIAPAFIDYLLTQMPIIAERYNKEEIYWQLWKELSQKVQKIAIDTSSSNYRSQDTRKLIRNMLQADSQWQMVEYENQYLTFGKNLLLEFAKNAGKNADVFGSLASLIYHFPSIFFESGIHILSKYQKEEGGTRLLLGVNTAFYLERAIQRFLQLDQTGSLPRTMHESCFVLLNAIIETASARAYYIREHLIRSRRIL